MEIKKTLKIMCMFVVMLVSLIPMSVALSLNSNNPNLIVTFDKLQDVNITIKKRMVDSMESPMDLGPDDQVILTLIKVEGEPGEQEFVQFLDYRPDSGPQTIQLVPGDYVVDGKYIVNKEVIIPGRRETYCKGYGEEGGKEPEQIASDFTTTAGGVVAGAAVASVIGAGVTGGLAAAGAALTSLGSFAGIAAALGPVGLAVIAIVAIVAVVASLIDCVGEEIPVDIPEVPMDPAILGGVTGNITITDHIYSDDSLTFYVFAIENPLFIEDLNILQLIEELGITYPEYIRPN